MVRKPMTVEEALPQMLGILSQGESFRLLVTGTSMLPFLRDRQDSVILSPAPRSIRKGDILFYRRSVNICVLHRVHRIIGDGTLLLCGDAQTRLETVHPDQIVGIVSAIERNGVNISCDHRFWRALVALWQLLFPLRPYVLAALRRLHII